MFRRYLYYGVNTLLLCVLCITIGVVGMRFYGGGSIIVSPMSRESIEIHSSESARYFYEPIPSRIEESTEPWLPKPARQTINSDSLNERYEYQIEKPYDVVRIAVLGDSFTYGMYVDTEDNYSEILEDMLHAQCPHTNQRYQVLNAGVPGYDIAYTVERFTQRVQKYQPDIVLWYLNDSFAKWNDILIPLNNECAHRSDAQVYDEVQDDGSVLHTCSQEAGRELGRQKSNEDIFLYQSHKLRDLVSKDQYQWVLLTHRDPGTKIADFIQEVASENTFIYDVVSVADQLRNKVDILPDGHPSPEGHRKIARDIFTYLVSNEIISCAGSQ